MKMSKEERAQAVNKLRSVISLADILLMDNVVFADKKADCPFCNSKDQFTVDINKAVFTCFKCRQGGDLFSYIMAKDGVDFDDACMSLVQIVSNRLSKSVALNKAFNKSYAAFKQVCVDIVNDTSCRGGADPRLLKGVCELSSVWRIMNLASKVDLSASQTECQQKVEEIVDIADRGILNHRGFSLKEWKSLAEATYANQ